MKPPFTVANNWSKFKVISQKKNVPYDALFQICTNVSAPLYKKVVWALDKKYL